MGAGVAHMFLRPLVAEAQGIIPQRLLMIHRPCGTWPDDFLPPKGAPAGTGYPITPILKSFEALRHKMVVFRGVDGPPNNTQNGDRHGAGLIGQITGRLRGAAAQRLAGRSRRHATARPSPPARPASISSSWQNGIAGVQPAAGRRQVDPPVGQHPLGARASTSPA